MDCGRYIANTLISPRGPQQGTGTSADAFPCKILNKVSLCKDRELKPQDGLIYARENSCQSFPISNDIVLFMKSTK